MHIWVLVSSGACDWTVAIAIPKATVASGQKTIVLLFGELGISLPNSVIERNSWVPVYEEMTLGVISECLLYNLFIEKY